MTEPGRSQRGLLGLTRILGLLIGAVLTVILARFSIQDSNTVLGIVSGIIALVTFYLFIADRARKQEPLPKEDEATADLRMRMLEQWEPEIRRRLRSSPHSETIPLEWKNHGENGEAAFDGRLAGDLDEAARQLATAFEALPGKKRMVVLGEPGAGKTFLALTLTVGLLRRWTGSGPIAVFLSLSSWDPVVDDNLDEWIVRSIAGSYYGSAVQTPRTLLTARRILPVLDGLDELPEHLRRMAVRRINDTLTGDRPVVVTCRTAEYEEMLTGGSPALLRAPAIEVQQVAVADLVAQLKGVPTWRKIVRHIQNRPNGHVALTLRTPLMLSLFTAVYQERDPGELLDRNKFASRHAVEDHLVDLRLDTAFPSEAPWGRWTAAKARKWLTYLAEQMHSQRERDITWWKVAFRVTDVGPLGKALVIVAAVWWLDLTFSSRAASYIADSIPLFSLCLGAFFASVGLGTLREQPGKVRPATDRQLHGFSRGMTIGFLTVLIPGLLVVIVSSLSDLIGGKGYPKTSAMACTLLALALVSGLGIGLHEMLVDRATAKHTTYAARDLLKRERASTFLAAGAAGLVVGPLSIFAATVVTPLGTYFGQWVVPALDLPAVIDLRLRPLTSYVSWPLSWNVLAEMSALIGILVTLMTASTRAWPRLLAARLKLARSGRLPWRLERFVADATRLGLLRRIGIAYEFGHVLLQARLVGQAVNRPPLHHRPFVRIVVLGTAAMLLVLVTGVALTGRPKDCDSARRAEITAPMQRAKAGEETACFAYMDDHEWRRPQLDPADARLMADILAPSPGALGSTDHAGHGVVSVFGEFDLINVAEWHDVLVGVAAAQRTTKGSIDIDFVFADLESGKDKEAAELVDLYLDATTTSRNRHGLVQTRSYAAVGLEIEWSRKSGSTEIIGLKDAGLYERASEFAKSKVSEWLGPSPTDSTTCSAVEHVRAKNSKLDLRQVHVSEALLTSIADCGHVTALVSQADAVELNRLTKRPPRISLYYFDDRSSTIVEECALAVGTRNTAAESVKTCVAVVSTNESYRADLVLIPQPLSP